MQAKRKAGMSGYQKVCIVCETKLKKADRYCRQCGRRQPDTIKETEEVNVYPSPFEGTLEHLLVKTTVDETYRSRADNPRVENGCCGAMDRRYGVRITGDNVGANITFDSLQEAENFACWMLRQIADQREAHDLHHSPESSVETTADLQGDQA